MAGQLGVTGLFTGMGARLVMIGTLTAGQCEYDSTGRTIDELMCLLSPYLRRHQKGAKRQGRCRDRSYSQVMDFFCVALYERFGPVNAPLTRLGEAITGKSSALVARDHEPSGVKEQLPALPSSRESFRFTDVAQMVLFMTG